MKVNEIEIGQTYHLSGDIENGYFDGKPYISHEEVTRKVTRITDTQIICECGRRFLINEHLEVSIPRWRLQQENK